MGTPAPLHIALMSAKEALIGALIALVAGAPFWIAEMAGEFIDFIRQAPDAEVQYPDRSTQQGIMASILSLFFSLYFVSINGLAIITGIIYSSYEIWPALSSMPFPNGANADSLLAMLDFIMRSALLLAAPVAVFVIMGYLITVIVSKILPQMNVTTMSMGAKNIAFLFSMQIYGMYFISEYTSVLSHIKSTLSTVKDYLHGG